MVLVSQSRRTERLGVAATMAAFEGTGFIFREQSTGDHGIDAHVELLADDVPTGKLIALQIKAGPSYFREKKETFFVFRAKPKHFDYWINHALPVLICVFDPRTEEVYWQLVSEEAAIRSGKNYKFEVPLSQRLATTSNAKLRAIAELSRSDRIIIGSRLEEEVASIYGSLGYAVARDVALEGRSYSHLLTSILSGVGQIRTVVRCFDTNERAEIEIDAFVSDLAVLRQRSDIARGVLVLEQEPSTSILSRVHSSTTLTATSKASIVDQLFDSDAGLLKLSRSVTKDDVLSRYIKMSATMQNWDKQSQMSIPDVSDALLNWLESDKVSRVYVLGDFGAGKSTLMRFLQSRMAKSCLDRNRHRLPLLVELREYALRLDLDAVLRNAIIAQYFVDLIPSTMWELLNAGRFTVLLDGFDEMVDRSDANRRAELLSELEPLLDIPTVTVLTSRPSYLSEPGEVERLAAGNAPGGAGAKILAASGSSTATLGPLQDLQSNIFERYPGVSSPIDPAISSAGATLLSLDPLDTEAVREFVVGLDTKFQAEAGVTSAEVNNFIETTYDLSDLVRRPMLLQLIVETILSGGLKFDRPGETLGPSALYEVYTGLKLQIDWEKGEYRRSVGMEDRRGFAVAMAVAMFHARAFEVSLDRVRDVITAFARGSTTELPYNSLSETEIESDLLTCSFITVENGWCRFTHKSFMEFFVARRIRYELPNRSDLLGAPLSSEILYFLGGFAPSEPEVADHLLAIASEDEVPARERSNAIAAYFCSAPNHTGEAVDGVSIESGSFPSLRLTEFELRDVVFAGDGLGLAAG